MDAPPPADESTWKSLLASLAASGPSGRTAIRLCIRANVPTGAAAVGAKLLSAVLSQGMSTMRKDAYVIDTVGLPETCCLCDLAPGTVEKSAQVRFARASGAAGVAALLLGGLDMNAVAVLPYKVCSRCAPRKEEAIQIQAFGQIAEGWLLALSVLNPSTAAKLVKNNFAVATSREGGREAYPTLQADGRLAVVVDGTKYGPYDALINRVPRFTADSKRVVWAARVGQVWKVYVDGKPGHSYDDFLLPTASPPFLTVDERAIAYGAKDASGLYIVHEDQRSGPYQDHSVDTPKFSADGGHVVWAVTENGKWRVVIDGRPEPACDGILAGTPQFGPVGARLAYGAREGDAWFVVADGQRHGPYPALLAETPQFSPDGQTLVWGYRRGDAWFVVTNGRETGPFDDFFWARDHKGFLVGNSLVYAVKQAGAFSVVVGDQTHGPYQGFSADGIAHSPEKTQFAWAARLGDKWHVVVDGRTGPAWDGILKGTPVWSPDGKHVTYGAQRGDQWYAVVDGTEHGPFSALGADGPRFTREGRYVVWYGKVDGKWRVFVNGRASEPADDIIAAKDAVGLVGPDSRRVSCVLLTPRGRYCLLDDKTFGPYDDAGYPDVHPESGLAVWRVRRGNHVSVVVEGEPHAAYDGFAEGSPRISPDGRRIAYGAQTGKDWFVVVDRETHGPYRSILKDTPRFSGDGQRVIWAAQGAFGWLVYANGKKEGRALDVKELQAMLHRLS